MEVLDLAGDHTVNAEADRRPVLRRLGGYLVAYAAIAAGLWLAFDRGLAVVWMLRDPLTAAGPFAGVHPWYGLLSQVGVLLWGLAAGCCLLAASMCRERGRGSDARFLAGTGALLALLGADDALLLHDHLVVRLVDDLDAEQWVLAVLGLAAATWVLAFRRRLLGPELPWLLLVGACFVASMGVDALVDDPAPGWSVAEDGAKLAGIVTFAHVAVVWARDALRRSV